MAVQAVSWEHGSDKKKHFINCDIKKISRTVLTGKVHVGFKTRFMFGMMQIKG